MKSELQQLNESNIRSLDQIAPEVFDNPIDPVNLLTFIKDARHVMFIALDNGTDVGMASAVEYFHPDKPPQLWINEVGVTPSHRQQGIGRALVKSLIEVAKQRNCVYAWLGADMDNTSAQLCFSSVEQCEEPLPFLLYEWDLEE